MAQPPFLLDILQIEPGSGQTLTISRNAADSTLRFVDAIVSGGITLPELVGLRNVTGLFLVGRGGGGSTYTSIQEALDAIPDSSSANAPSVVLIMSGVYEGNIKIQKDGVFLIGLGATLKNSGAGHTIEVSASQTATPESVVLSNLTIQNDEPGHACLKITGADSFASGTVTVNAAPLATGDLITIGGINLVGTAGGRTSGSDNFSVSGGTVDAIAAEIAASINDPGNSFAGSVNATSVLGVVTITAITAGSGGNAITLTVATVPAGNMTASGATLLGGGAAGNNVGLGQILAKGCVFQADAVGGNYQVWSDTANVVRIQGGSFAGSALSSNTQAANTAEFNLMDVGWVGSIGLSYDTGDDQPATLSSEYLMSNIPTAGDVTVSLTGLGSLTITSCSCGDLTVGGDQSVSATQSKFGDLSLADTVAVALDRCTRVGLVNAGGSPTLAETMATGAVGFVASNSEAVTFTVEQPDAAYTVLLDVPTVAVRAAVTARDAAGFTVSTDVLCNDTVRYTIFR